MEFDLSVSVIAVAVVALVAFLVFFLVKVGKNLEAASSDFHRLTNESVKLIQKLDALTDDLQSKSESLNCLFRPFKALSKERHSDSEAAMEVVDWLRASLVLVQKIRTYVKQYEK